MNEKIPTLEFYKDLQEIYNIFNRELFDNTLPNCLITVQRKKQVMGYFSPDRWINDKGKKNHELALNPAYFGSCNFIEIFQTVVHEMCHLWQFEFGTPSRKTYHNQEWANKMESIGLIPSDTGRAGGKKTGQKMNDYPERGGKFEKLCIKIFKDGLYVKWFDRFPDEITVKTSLSQEDYQELDEEELQEVIDSLDDDKILENLYTTVGEIIKDILPVEEVRALNETKQKTKYMCPQCNSSVWGKPNLSIKCNSCNIDFFIVT
ncbi:SprT-like domain-containing protein [Aliarcobacter butzleri]|uniref:SprT-like domain-containing protein n=1 Tax=Aliarcobacter butzleri TaxID=28197 RepID=UPI001EDB49F7|nr:SprT-like domain-containing protein [Aliarcobacter butzleri]MCG3668325.1 SprT-like domain-containing protein [Aliarcobacter butzleri]MDN5112983.1 SprT-like domain-containing protein [Aliarcobacter butzleri]